MQNLAYIQKMILPFFKRLEVLSSFIQTILNSLNSYFEKVIQFKSKYVYYYINFVFYHSM